ncbi:hypothetical protein ACIQF6_05400 [Kitasatospora sp. NPDC092948]|uniref:hypothetical protein n=1 Tax=Kitasatospora sp. NPDC092948 TaxID=3364088 RepID=UPI00380F5AC8
MTESGEDAGEPQHGFHGLVALLVLLDALLLAAAGVAYWLMGISHPYGPLRHQADGTPVRHHVASHTPFRAALVVAGVLTLIVLALLLARQWRPAAVQGVLMAGAVAAAVLLYPHQPAEPPKPRKHVPYEACYSGGKCYRWDENGDSTEIHD